MSVKYEKSELGTHYYFYCYYVFFFFELLEKRYKLYNIISSLFYSKPFMKLAKFLSSLSFVLPHSLLERKTTVKN